ncbi:MAG: 2-dehydropantoate 2-reductase [Hyphomicrobiales bacterium]|nr:2-dehydropantoate 2-reductase [Hyphomicrobiales bacterium]MBV8440317.1 2-dehydropantoate 2-reductase [Hyphomicrobiales bacterium]
MRIAVLGGGGAMGGLFGGYLARAGEDVTLIDVSQASIDAINHDGLAIEEKDGSTATIRVKASLTPLDVGPVDLIVNFVKCYNTEAAIGASTPMLGDGTAILTLQNGWGNVDRIAAVAGKSRVIVGLTYHSGTLIGPGRVRHSGSGMTHVGEIDGSLSPRLVAAVAAFRRAGVETAPSSRIVDEIWKKLALNVCTLPTAALLRFQAHELMQHEGTIALMEGLLAEVVAVAKAQGINIDHAERRQAIANLLGKAIGARASMLQDVEASRQTEIDVINGAIVTAGQRCSVPTPFNLAMVWMVRSLQAKYLGQCDKQ